MQITCILLGILAGVYKGIKGLRAKEENQTRTEKRGNGKGGKEIKRKENRGGKESKRKRKERGNTEAKEKQKKTR